VPVVVTGASGAVAAALIPLLVGRGSEVRAVLRDRPAAGRLRDLGAKVAVCQLGHTDTLEAVMEGAHTVVHLAGGLDVSRPVGSEASEDDLYEESNLLTVRWTLEAALEARVSRFLFLSYVGADPDSINAYLRAKGRAEDEVRSSGLQHAIVRSTHIYGPGCRWLEEMEAAARGPVAVVVGDGRQEIAPVFVGDVAGVLAAADDRDVEVRGTYGLQGPDVLTADAFVDMLAGRRRRKLHLSPGAARRVARLTGRRLTPILLDVIAADSVADAPDAASEFGVSLTSLSDGLARS
jgi:uncharacterized protein YbjT (DUF2867 family)